MYNLLNFLIKNAHWFVFILLEVICFYFVFSENSYQRSAFLNSSNELSGKIYEVSSETTAYFGLKKENSDLLEHNGALRNRIKGLEERIFELEKDSIRTIAYLESDFHNGSDDKYIAARVISNSVNKAHNTITINKGAKDGITPGMGVISENGIVGEVRAVSRNYSIIQSLLNTNSVYNCKLLNTDTFGPLKWIDQDPKYATLLELPTYKEVSLGDTIVTSGHSDIFPRGIFVGTVSKINTQEDLNQYKLTVELSTDFYSLQNVLVVKESHIEEIRNLEKQIQNAKN